MTRIIKSRNFSQNFDKISQNGSSLVISLLLMIALVLVAFASASSSLFQERMAGNVRDRAAAFNAAEAALRDAEEYMRSNPILPLFNGASSGPSKGHFKVNTLNLGVPNAELPAGALPNDVSTEGLWASKTAIAAIRSAGIRYGSNTSRPAIPDLPEQPIFVLEEMPQQPGRMMTYRITSIGFGRNDAIVVLQTYYTPPQLTVI
jgi:type IV pilus assembly protein PilX